MKTSSLSVVLLVILFLFACSSKRDKLVGVWKVSIVTVNADSNMASNETILKIEQAQKSVSFELFKDSTVNLLAGATGMPGRWTYNEATGEVFIVFSGSSPTDMILLGKYDHGVIIKTENTPYGMLTSVYEKK